MPSTRGLLAYVGDPQTTRTDYPARACHPNSSTWPSADECSSFSSATFGEGKLNPLKRPGASRWRDALWLAHDNVIECADGCGWTYYRLLPKCPACGQPTPPMIFATVFPEWGETEWSGITPKPGTPCTLAVLARRRSSERHLWGALRLEETHWSRSAPSAKASKSTPQKASQSPTAPASASTASPIQSHRRNTASGSRPAEDQPARSGSFASRPT